MRKPLLYAKHANGAYDRLDYVAGDGVIFTRVNEPSLLDGITAAWHLEEGSGGPWLDASGNGLTLTDVIPGGALQVTGKFNFGVLPRAAPFYSTLTSANIPGGRRTRFSASFWYNAQSQSSGGRGMIGDWHYTGNIGAWAIGYTAGAFHNYVKVPGVSASSYYDGYFNFTPDNAWHHYAYVFNGSAIGSAERFKIYHDGVAQTLTFVGPLGAAPAAIGGVGEIETFGLGQSLLGIGWYANYYFDELVLWNDRALSATDVWMLYNG